MAVRALNDAVGRIDSTLTGTGFIVDKAKGLIVTCKHVVRGEKTAPFTLQQLNFTVECTVEEAAAGQADWALLTAKKPLPANAAELKLYRFRWNDCKIPFTSYGFATLYPARGGFLSGEVRGVVNDKNQLSIDVRTDELAGRQHAEVLGQSGAPCLVNGVAVGLVWATLTKGAGSTLLVIPADVLYEESGQRIPLVDAVKLPYDDIFASLLSQFSRATLQLAGRALMIDDNSGSDDVYRARVAYSMISGGLDATAKALVQFKLFITQPVARSLIVLAESLWIDGLAAQIASELADSPLPRGLIWNATYDTTIRELLQRACWHRHGTLPTWDEGSCLIVHNPTGEPHGSGLVAQINALFKSQLNKEPDQIKAYLGSTILSPVIAVLFDMVPSDELLTELEKHYPGLCVLFICAEPPQDLPNVTLIQPWAEAKREYEAARVARERREELRRHLKFTIEGKDLCP